mgnify:CR=1 FL=1
MSKKMDESFASMGWSLSVVITILLWLAGFHWKVALGVFIVSLGIVHYTDLALANQKRKLLMEMGMDEVDQMTGLEFEEWLAELYRKKGYTVQLTPQSNDFGADLIVKREGKLSVIQAKRYKNKVGLRAIQEIVAAKPHYKAHEAFVITNNYFTAPAQKLAKSNGIKLIDREGIVKMYRTIKK